MRTFAGGANFDKTIGEQLFDQMQDCKASLESNENDVLKDILKFGQFQKHIKEKQDLPKRANTAGEGTRRSKVTQTSEIISKKLKKATNMKTNIGEQNGDGSLAMKSLV